MHAHTRCGDAHVVRLVVVLLLLDCFGANLSELQREGWCCLYSTYKPTYELLGLSPYIINSFYVTADLQ